MTSAVEMAERDTIAIQFRQESLSFKLNKRLSFYFAIGVWVSGLIPPTNDSLSV